MIRQILLFSGILTAGLATAKDVYVAPHVTKNGNFVSGHYRSNPDSSRLNNYSTQGNVNPYTGQAGNAPIYTPPQPVYPQPQRSHCLRDAYGNCQ